MSAIADERSEDRLEPLQGSLVNVLGLRCLSIVLSYLEEYEGTSFLLCHNKYWTDTILACYRVASQPSQSKPRATQSDVDNAHCSQSAKKEKQKYRHQFSGRVNSAAVIQIPDASTRLERLNTRRWNVRQRQLRKLKWQGNHKTPNETDNVETDGKRSLSNFTMTQLAEAEWKETVSEKEDSTFKNDNGKLNKNIRRRWIMNPPLLRFYNGDTHPGNGSNHRLPLFRDGTTCLASYPRSGNTLLRSLLETVTGFVTASDTRPDRNLSVALAEKPPYFVGEGTAPPKEGRLSPFLPPTLSDTFLPPPPICKTHWPERIGCHAYDCKRVVLLVRNPFDAVHSYWHMCLTKSHTEKVKHEVTEKHKKFFEALVRHEILQVWMSFLDYYWYECSKKDVPLLLVRYEDLVLHPKNELQRILEFCCHGSNINDNNRSAEKKNDYQDWWKKRLEEVTWGDGDEDDIADKSLPAEGKSGSRRREYGYRSCSSREDQGIQDVTRNPSKNDNNSASGSRSTDGNNATTNVPESGNQRGDSDLSPHTNNGRSSHPSIGRSLRNGLYPKRLLETIHGFDDVPMFSKSNRLGTDAGNWLERLGYHVYKQGFPDNLDRLPPLPVLMPKTTTTESESRIMINIPKVSLELRPRNSPYGRKMTQWRRKWTANDTKPFPTI